MLSFQLKQKENKVTTFNMTISPLRIVFMGTPEFAVASLDALVKAGYNIVGVITAPDKPAGRGMTLQQSAVKKYATEHHLKVKKSWITQSFEGLFAARIILEGEKICEYRGKLLNTLQALKVVDKSYLMRISCQCYVDAKESTCLARSVKLPI